MKQETGAKRIDWWSEQSIELTGNVIEDKVSNFE